MPKASSSSIERVRRRREKLRREGMRPLQLWLRDPTAPHFAAEAARQSRLVAAATPEEELAFLDQLADDLDPAAR
jgi:hypothetical protein